MELRRQDVNLTRGPLTVSRAVTRVAGADPIVGDPKSEAGNRVVSIPPHILPAFKEHLKKHTGVERDALLFRGRDSGEQLAPSTLYRWYYPAREAAGRKDLRWHDLRHTSATMAAETGASLRDLMHRHGHSTAAASLRYQHYVLTRDQELAASCRQWRLPEPEDQEGPGRRVPSHGLVSRDNNSRSSATRAGGTAR